MHHVVALLVQGNNAGKDVYLTQIVDRRSHLEHGKSFAYLARVDMYLCHESIVEYYALATHSEIH